MSENVKYLNDENFTREIEADVTLVDFYADWCGPCRMIAPIIEELANEKAEGVSIAKINIDENQATPTMFGVTSIPTVIIFKDGKEVQRVVGVRDKEAFKKLIDAAR